MSDFCNSCGISIPDGQSFCSMCYGDPAYGRDGYYENYLRRQEEKRGRDFGGPLRWITRCIEDVEYLKCPKCSWDDLDIDHEAIFDYCPSCGARLLPPGGGKNERI